MMIVSVGPFFMKTEVETGYPLIQYRGSGQNFICVSQRIAKYICKIQQQCVCPKTSLLLRKIHKPQCEHLSSGLFFVNQNITEFDLKVNLGVNLKYYVLFIVWLVINDNQT